MELKQIRKKGKWDSTRYWEEIEGQNRNRLEGKGKGIIQDIGEKQKDGAETNWKGGEINRTWEGT